MENKTKEMTTNHMESNEFEFVEWPFYWLTRTSDRYIQHLELALKQADLDIPTWRVLMQLKKNSYVSVSSIAEHALIKLPTMTKIIQRLQINGLVSCHASPTDARVTEVTITKAGMKARESAWTEAQRLGDLAMAGMSEVKLKSLHQLLDHLFNNLGPIGTRKNIR